MELGAFSISLAVKDLATSRDFYEKLGFEVTGGEADQNWLILRNGDVYLTELANHLFGPDLKETAAQGVAKGGDPVAEAMAEAKAEEKAQQ